MKHSKKLLKTLFVFIALSVFLIASPINLSKNIFAQSCSVFPTSVPEGRIADVNLTATGLSSNTAYEFRYQDRNGEQYGRIGRTNSNGNLNSEISISRNVDAGSLTIRIQPVSGSGASCSVTITVGSGGNITPPDNPPAQNPPANQPPADNCSKADINKDGQIDDNDAQTIATYPPGYAVNPDYDLNGDGKIDSADVAIVYSCRTPVADTPISPFPLPDTPELTLKGFTADNIVGKLIGDILPYVLGIAGFLTVIFVIISGIQFVTSSGNPEAAAAARSRLIFALVGFALIILAFAATQIVDRIFLGGSGIF